jgi:hypothetical protein
VATFHLAVQMGRTRLNGPELDAIRLQLLLKGRKIPASWSVCNR